MSAETFFNEFGSPREGKGCSCVESMEQDSIGQKKKTNLAEIYVLNNFLHNIIYD